MTISMKRQRWGALALVIGLAVLGTFAVRDGSASGHATAMASATKKVDIRNFAFHPGTITVKRGSQVSFTNSSGVTHTASGRAFDTKRIAPGTTATVTLNKRGTFAYHCKIHNFMKGKIVVE
jgi:plastocyanin